MPDDKGVSMPEKIGRYQIIRKLSDGLCGPVYLGSLGDLKVAVKIPRSDVSVRLDNATRFTGEITHSNIIPYKEIEYLEDGNPFFVMDYFQIWPIHFKRFANKSRIEIINSIITIADALASAHDKGAVHGNIKPSNVFIRLAGKDIMPLIGDFGISYIWNKNFFTGQRFTSVFPYMAPEVIESITTGADPESYNVSPSSDLYSLTTVLVEVLTGHQIFEGILDIDTLIEAKNNKNFKMLTINYPFTRVDINKLNQLVSSNLSPDPDKRLSSSAKYRDLLKECLLAEPVSAIPNEE